MMISRLCIGLFLVAHVVVLMLTTVTAGLVYFHYFYGPTKWFEEIKGKYNIERDDESPIPETKFHELLVQPFFSPEKRADIVRQHGVAAVNKILTKQTAHTLREYVLERNINGRQHSVIEPTHRHHILPSPKDPAVKQALKEIGSHAILRPLLESILGPSPSLLSLNAITTTYGSVDQFWHDDTGTSHAIYPDRFVAEYTVGITLQDITEDMGATGVCPGTRNRKWPFYNLEEEEAAIDQVPIDKEAAIDDVPIDVACPIRMVQSQGDGFLYSSDTFHKGRAHSDESAPDRVVLFLTFAESRKATGEKRIFPLGTIHSLELDSWGQTLDDMATIDERPWRPWHSIGLFNGHNGSIRPWTLLDALAQIYADDDEPCYAFGNGSDRFYKEDVEGWVLRLIFISWISNLVLYGIGVPCVALWMCTRSSGSVVEKEEATSLTKEKHV